MVAKSREGYFQEQDWLSLGIQVIISNSPETGLDAMQVGANPDKFPPPVKNTGIIVGIIYKIGVKDKRLFG